MFQKFNPNKLKSQLKMAVHRFQISSNKKTALLQQQKRTIAQLLAEDPPKEEKARIRAESMIMEDNTIEAYEILSLSCDLLGERMRLIASQQGCPPDLVSTISTLLWASNRVDITELGEIRKQFKLKFGKKFEEDAMMNAGGVVNERVLVKLGVQPPSGRLVQAYLHKIAQEFEVDWEPKELLTNEQLQHSMVPPQGYSIPVAGGSGLGGGAPYPGGGGGGGGGGIPVVLGVPSEIPAAPTSQDVLSNHPKNPDNDDVSRLSAPSVVPDSNTNDNEHAYVPPPTTTTNNTNDDSSYNDLNARFEALNKK